MPRVAAIKTRGIRFPPCGDCSIPAASLSSSTVICALPRYADFGRHRRLLPQLRQHSLCSPVFFCGTRPVPAAHEPCGGAGRCTAGIQQLLAIAAEQSGASAGGAKPFRTVTAQDLAGRTAASPVLEDLRRQGLAVEQKRLANEPAGGCGVGARPQFLVLRTDIGGVVRVSPEPFGPAHQGWVYEAGADTLEKPDRKST